MLRFLEPFRQEEAHQDVEVHVHEEPRFAELVDLLRCLFEEEESGIEISHLLQNLGLQEHGLPDAVEITVYLVETENLIRQRQGFFEPSLRSSQGALQIKDLGLYLALPLPLRARQASALVKASSALRSSPSTRRALPR